MENTNHQGGLATVMNVMMTAVCIAIQGKTTMYVIGKHNQLP